MIHYRLLRIHGCWIASLLVNSMLGLPVKQIGVFPTFAPCLEHVCAGGGEGSVANVGLYGFCIIISEGIIDGALILCYL